MTGAHLRPDVLRGFFCFVFFLKQKRTYSVHDPSLPTGCQSLGNELRGLQELGQDGGLEERRGNCASTGRRRVASSFDTAREERWRSLSGKLLGEVGLLQKKKKAKNV